MRHYCMDKMRNAHTFFVLVVLAVLGVTLAESKVYTYKTIAKQFWDQGIESTFISEIGLK